MGKWGKALLTALALSALTACVGGPAQDRSRVVEVIPAQPSEEAAPRASDIENGYQIAEHYCSGCHAIGPAGESHHPMAPPFRTLSRNYPVNALEEAFAEGILVGHRDMPEFRLEPAQIADLVAYLQSIQERRGG
jgi:mono/diheme cytochrome c family protein